MFSRPSVAVRAFPLPFLMLFFCIGGWAQEGPKISAEGVDMEWGVKIPMRDGVKLNATVYRPHGKKEALPLIFTLTPYIGDSYTDRAMYFAKHAYVYALVIRAVRE